MSLNRPESLTNIPVSHFEPLNQAARNLARSRCKALQWTEIIRTNWKAIAHRTLGRLHLDWYPERQGITASPSASQCSVHRVIGRVGHWLRHSVGRLHVRYVEGWPGIDDMS
jgi:hypothetical protein